MERYIPTHAGDWPEDFEGENGNYENVCIECNQRFTGHKRRLVCKLCDKLLKEYNQDLLKKV